MPAASDLDSIMNRSRRPKEGPSVATFPRVHRERSVGCAHDHPPGLKTQRCPVTPKCLDPPKPLAEQPVSEFDEGEHAGLEVDGANPAVPHDRPTAVALSGQRVACHLVDHQIIAAPDDRGGESPFLP